MAPNVDFKTGEHVYYNGKNATIIDAHSFSDTVTIIVDGQEYSVNINDLFGMNEQKNDYYFDKQIEYYDEQIEKNKQIIKEQDTLWNIAKATIKNCRQQMASILRTAGVSSFPQIDDEAQKAQYLSFRDSKDNARRKQIRAVSETIHAANNTASAAIGKMNVTNQKTFFGLG